MPVNNVWTQRLLGASGTWLLIASPGRKIDMPMALAWLSNPLSLLLGEWLSPYDSLVAACKRLMACRNRDTEAVEPSGWRSC